LANRITVSSEVHAASLITNGYPAEFVPDSWQESNPFWTNTSPAHHRINLGWSSAIGDVNDLLLIKRVIVRILREFADTQILVSGDPQAYRLFDTIAENRRIFMPVAAAEEYPYQLSQMDILLVPMRNDPYHFALSDRVVMEAGARGIPWIASPVQAVVNWQAGGLVANSQDEWYLYLRELVSNAGVRSEFAKAGMTAAQNRRDGCMGEYWMKAIFEATQQQTSRTA
jgi:glycosyltransferase involved in cell wall biosynthesis